MRALAILVLLAVLRAQPLLAAPNLFGEPGLILTPTADATPRGEYTFGVNTVDEAFRRYPAGPEWVIQPRATVVHYYHIGLLPSVSATVGFANVHGKLFARYFDTATDPMVIRKNPAKWVGGWPIDRFMSLRFQVARQGRGWPGVAIGLRDSDGTSVFGANYVVASARFPHASERGRPLGLGIHLGYGHASSVSIRRGSRLLDGGFGGIDYWPSTRWGVMAEATPHDLHVGARWSITRQLQLQPSLFGLRWFGGGISLTSRM